MFLSPEIAFSMEHTESPDAAMMELLLLADPDRDAVSRYAAAGRCHRALLDGALAGAAVLCAQRDGAVELMNISVRPDLQGRGLGKSFLRCLIEEARAGGYKDMTVATGNSSLGPLALYQKAGFRITGVTPDYFDSYPEPIEESGIRCRDRIHLRLNLVASHGV